VQVIQRIQSPKALHLYNIMIGYLYYGFRKTTRTSWFGFKNKRYW